jgi:hypothetical protein
LPVAVSAGELRFAVTFDATEVVLSMRIVILGKVAIRLNFNDEICLGDYQELRNISRHQNLTADKGASEVIVERPDAVRSR